MFHHPTVQDKLDYFLRVKKIPNIIFHGSSGTGKRTIVQNFLHQIYGGDQQKLKRHVMFVNCSEGKGIKFIRNELKFFAKTNIHYNTNVLFKSIVLFNADSLTTDAQSALRRCIELFSHNTRFFIVVENKHKLLNPILSRFCEIYIPEILDANAKCIHLHKYKIDQIFAQNEYDFSRAAKLRTMLEVSGCSNTILTNENNESSYSSIQNALQLSNTLYEMGYSAFDIISLFPENYDMQFYFYQLKAAFRCEKMLIFYLLHNGITTTMR